MLEASDPIRANPGAMPRHWVSDRSRPDTEGDIAREVATVAHLSAIPGMLQLLCETTAMGFAAVARVTDKTWVACAVLDAIDFGLKPGGQLDVNTTLCLEVMHARTPIFIDHASIDPVYRDHPTPKLYEIESYISVPIIMPDGRYFGNLCAIDRHPANVSDVRTIALFKGFAQMIGVQLEADLARQNEQTALLDERAVSELREQFIAVLGHDLRSPLAAISASSRVLAKRVTDPVMAEIAQRIATNATRMSALIDDVLDFARGRLGGGIGIQFQTVDDVETRLRAVVNEISDSYPDRRLNTSINMIGRVRCDLARLQQLASNLLGNALTHGPPNGTVEIRAHVNDSDLVLQVWNDGEPIPPESLGKIFGPFWRNSTSGSRQGLGLGLHICSEIVKAHGGHLSVTSTREGGTQFTARLPLGSG